jgi:hypothetical protein
MRSGDHFIVWSKPKRSDWMSQEEYERVPETLTVREFHAGGKIMVTTFLCPKDTPKGMLKALYRNRWSVELDLRNISPRLIEAITGHRTDHPAHPICRIG